MKITTTASTGHLIIVDPARLSVAFSGDAETVQQVPDHEIDAACAAAGLTCIWEPIDSMAYACVRAPAPPRRRGDDEAAHFRGC